ncbi:hypothetical protein [Gordonia sp. (in: high G+C Gram-positive bacteria)]|uniref:hypothetical protein n=1 Tax=Gordonia sp. (in: high G+C Gram-positive bacteria) TaxID=84139 RepID=UPI003C720CDD
MTASVTPLHAASSGHLVAEIELHMQRIDACRRFLARRGLRLELTFCDVDGNELAVQPADADVSAVTACAAAWPATNAPNAADVVHVGVTDPIPAAALAAPGATLAAFNSAIGDLVAQFLMHPSERTQ